MWINVGDLRTIFGGKNQKEEIMTDIYSSSITVKANAYNS